MSKERKCKIFLADKISLDKLKISLLNTTMLVHYNPKLRRKISVDASDIAVGGILLQEDDKSPDYNSDTPIDEVKDWLPISFFSQKLLKHQRHYSTSEKELLAILVGIYKYNHYLEGDNFLIETVHHALCQFTKINFKNSRLQRWSITLSTYNFKVVYRKGATHPPDCFSRYQSEWKHRKTIDPEEEFLDKIFLTEYVCNHEDNHYYDLGLNIINIVFENPIFSMEQRSSCHLVHR